MKNTTRAKKIQNCISLPFGGTYKIYKSDECGERARTINNEIVVRRGVYGLTPKHAGRIGVKQFE